MNIGNYYSYYHEKEKKCENYVELTFLLLYLKYIVNLKKQNNNKKNKIK